MRFVVEIYRRRQYEAVLIVAELVYVYTELASRTAQAIPGERTENRDPFLPISAFPIERRLLPDQARLWRLLAWPG